MTTRLQAFLAAAIVVATVAVAWAASAVDGDVATAARDDRLSDGPAASGFLTIETPYGGLTIVTRFY